MSALAVITVLLAGGATLLALYALGRWFATARPEAGRLAWLLGALRLAALLLVVLALANPTLHRRGQASARPTVALLLDASASMALPDAGGESRWQRLRAMLEAPAARTALGRFTVRRLAFAGGLLASEPAAAPATPTTNLALALDQLGTAPVAQIVVVASDGVMTEGEALAAATRLVQHGATVHTVGVGPLAPPPDVALTAIQAPRVVREQEPFTVTASVSAPGLSGRGELTVTRDGQPAGRFPVQFAKSGGVRVPLRQPGLPAGVHLFTVALPEQGQEATATNNQRSFFVEARRDRNRILLVAGAASPEYANLRRVLLDLPRTDLTCWVRLAPGRFARQTADRQTMASFDWASALRKQHVVLVADLEAAALEATVLARFVREGGSLAVLGGARSLGRDYDRSALGPLLPLSATAYQAVPEGVAPPAKDTPLGQELLAATGLSPWRLAPYLAGSNAVTSVRPGAQRVLNTRTGRALMAVQGVGLGRCLALATDGTHRWVLSPEADDTSRDLHRRFWQQLVSWLAAPRDDSQVRLLLDPPVAAQGQPVRALVQVQRALQPVSKAQVTVQVRGPQATLAVPASLTATPGRYQAALSQLPPGRHEVQAMATTDRPLGMSRQTLVIEPGGAEVAQLTRQEGFLRQVAERGQGSYVPLEELPQLLARLDARPAPLAVPVATRPARSLPIFVVLLVLLTADWWLRRRYGW